MRTLNLILAVIAGTVLTLTAAPAVADSCCPPVLGDTGGTAPQPGNPPNNPGTPGTPTPAPEGTYWVYGGFPIQPGILNGSNGYGSDGYTQAWRCDPKGDDWFATSLTFVYLQDEDTHAYAGGWSYTCLYPPKPEDSVATCYPWLAASIARKVPNIQAVASKRITTAWGADRHSVQACYTSAQIALNAIIKPVGGYEIEVSTRALRCTIRKYYDGRGTKVLLPCGNPETITKAKRAAVWCDNGMHHEFGPTSWDGKVWDYSLCTGVNENVIQCQSYTSPVTFDAHTATRKHNPAQALDDNKQAWLKHQPLNVKGLRDLRDVGTRLRYLDGGAMRAGVSVNAGSQPTYLKDARFDTWYAGDVKAWDLRLTAPSPEGDPLTVQRESRFTGTLDAKTIRITGINVETMELDTTTVTVPTTVTSTCESAPAYVDSYRARTSTTR